jgi:ABC-type multidrug transport system fused ATPase/permease subunit
VVTQGRQKTRAPPRGAYRDQGFGLKQVLKAYGLLDATERRQAWLIVALVTVMALFDTLGAVSIMPFLAVLANPEMIETNATLAWANALLGGVTPQTFLLVLGCGSFTLLVLSAAVRGTGNFVVNRFAMMRGFTIGSRLMDSYLRQPYAYFLNRHTGDMSKQLVSEVAMLVGQVYQPAAQFIAQLVLLLVLLTLLVVVNPSVALIGALVLGGCYSVIYLFVRRYMSRAGEERVLRYTQRHRLTTEALGGVKTLKLQGREAFYRDEFSMVARRIALLQADTITVSTVPRFAIEAIAFGGVILLALGLMVQHQGDPAGSLASVLPLLGFYAFAGYRILPAVQGIYQATTQLRAGVASIEGIARDLAGRDLLPPLPETPATPLPFLDRVELDNLGFQYPASGAASLQGISLTLKAGTTLGIVGSTGAGKTTLVDLFLGLLTPGTGEIRVDGTAVTPQNLRAWQADLGYVPQDIFLLDASVAENIALGMKAEDIDMAQVREAARMAQILDFVETQMPQGFATPVGERGVRLSGGQRQRIGIARALFTNPGILVFDEATSALDNLTEQEVVRAINDLSGTKTILLIAHRISTVRDCDQILVMERGQMAGLGSYDDLYRDNATFRRLVDAREAS